MSHTLCVQWAIRQFIIMSVRAKMRDSKKQENKEQNKMLHCHFEMGWLL